MQNINMRMLRTLATALAIIGLLVWLFYMFVALGKVTVIAPQNATITVTDISTNKAQEFTDTASATAKVRPGTYIVAAKNGDGGSFVYVTADWFKKSTITLGPPQTTLHNTKMASVTAQAPTVQDGRLVYLDPTSQRAIAYGNAGSKTPLTDTTSNEGEDVIGTDGNTYRAQVVGGNTLIANDGSRLVTIKNGQVKNLNLEGVDGYITPLYAIIGANPNQESFTVTINGTVYLYASVDAKPQKILETKKRISHAAYGGNHLLLYSTDMPFAKQDITKAYTTNGYAVHPILVDLQQKTSKELAGILSDATISPDGNTATLQYRESSSLNVVSLPNGDQLFTVETPTSTSPLWVSNNEYVYEQNRQLRQFDVTSGKGQILGQVDASAISITKSGADYFVATYDRSEATPKSMVIRMSAKEPAAEVIAADQKLPLSGDGWRVEFTNIEQPTLVISTELDSVFDISKSDYKKQHLDLRTAALKAVRDAGIDPTKFTTIYTPNDQQLNL